jgi:hypothetical protein
MSPSFRTRPVTSIRIHCPVDAMTLDALLAGEGSALEQDETLAAMLAIVRRDTTLGDFGLYHSVVEASPGWELFTPGASANPTLGRAGAAETSPTVILTVHVAEGTPATELDRALADLLAAHPWETPVVEMCQTHLLVRA